MRFLRAILGFRKLLIIIPLIAVTGAGVWYFVTEYVERGIALKSLETINRQNDSLREQVKELTERAQEDEQEINESTDQVENPDEVADPWVVNHLKRLLDD